MRHAVHDPTPASSGPQPDSLYRLVFCGGPWDGYEMNSEILPDAYFQLQPDLRNANRGVGPATTLRLAQYRLVKSKILMSSGAPVVLCRFQYSGMVPSHSSQAPWWKRWLPAPRQ